MIPAKKATRRREGTIPILSWARRWINPWAELQQALEGVTQEYQALKAERDQLQETVATLQAEKLRLEDRVVASQQDRDRLWEAFQQALQGERTAYQMHVNLSMQRQGAGVPYPDAFHIPPASIPSTPGEAIGRKGRVLPSEVVQQAYRETAERLTQMAQG